jgi:two-component system cell cycle sensor histidine kinase/response regulator CckA
MMSKPLVLIIDDEAGPRESMRMILKNRYEVLLADGAESGLAMARERKPDVVFCDIRMPDIEGPEVLRRLKQIDPDVQVALITAYAAVDTAQQAVRHGAIDYITKPFSVQEILQVAERGVEQRREAERREALLAQLQPAAQALSGQLGTLSMQPVLPDQVTIYKNLAQAHNSIETQLSKLGRLNAIGEVAAEVAHDVRNFLTAILLRIEILLMDLKDPGEVNSESVKEALQDILRAASDGATAVQRISSIAKADPYEPFTLLSVNDVVNDVVNMAFGQFQAHQSVAIEVQTQDVPMIYGSPTALRTAVMNIVINARQALPETGGQVTITTGVEDGEVFIRVHDSGRGIAPEALPHITEPFFTTKGENGSGLGLSVARKVISCHEGRIEFHSVDNAGTTVALWLPVGGESKAAPPCPDAAPNEAGDVPDVLVVEDDVEMLTHVNSSLTAMGFRVEGARAADEALAKFEQYLRQQGRGPAAVITDLHLPGLLGTELARRIKKIAPATRIVLISGYITEESTQITCPYVDAIIKKPFRFPDLVKQLR